MGTKASVGAGLVAIAVGAASAALGQQSASPTPIDLPSSKQLMVPVPGEPQRVNSLPISLAVSPDGKWVVSLNAGYGTFESGYAQSLAVMNAATGEVKDYPDARVGPRAGQTFFSGLTFSADGGKLYASLASSTAPVGDGKNKTGNGVAVFAFVEGVPKAESFLPLPMVTLAAGRHTDLAETAAGTLGIPYPAAIAAFRPWCGAGVCALAEQHLLVAENLADSVVELDAAGEVLRTFDLSETTNVPGTYPVALALTKDGRRGFVALWNASEVAELDLVSGQVVRKVAVLRPHLDTAPGSHPVSLLLDEAHGRLYVALANRDAVAALEVGTENAPKLMVKGYFDTRLPGQSFFGAEPDALAINEDGSRLYAANMGSDAVAVMDTRRMRSVSKAKGMVEPMGFVPTEWMPTAMVASGGKLYVASDKGKGTGPNNFEQKVSPLDVNHKGRKGNTYIATLLYGSLARVDEATTEAGLRQSTADVMLSNRMRAATESIAFANGGHPIQHVIYILKENRTYDQLFGDLAVDGKPVGNGDRSLTMYGADVTPNQHKLALQFGVLDNFFDSGEVSGDGHVWSNAAIGTDYLERTWQQNYRASQRTYDYEGVVADGYPLLQHIADVEEPQSGYLWTNFAAHGKSIYHFGEYISSIFCGDKEEKKVAADPTLGAMSGGVAACSPASIKPGESIPDEWGGGKNVWPWAIPRLAANIATKPELVGHFAKETPDFNLRVPDQIRVEIFLRHLAKWKKDLAAGHDTMPNYIQLRLANDHTGGTTVGGPTPKSSIADNDLAIGRAVEAISHSGFWDSTAFFILEDDAQNGADHVDAHRSIGLVVSKYSPHAKAGDPAVVDSRFYSTVSFVRTMEALLGVPPMNNNDAFASMVSPLFTGPGDQAAFVADTSNRENGLIYLANKPTAPGAAESERMDFRHADRADAMKLNVLLWQDAMGAKPVPPMLLEKRKKAKDDDD